jgi:hypothetical protein
MKKLLPTLTFSVFIFLLKGQISTNAISVSPNPFTKRTLISYTVQSNDTISILVMDLTGMTKVTLRSNYFVSAGAHQDSLIMDGFPPGIYYISLGSKLNGHAVAKIIKSGITNIREININSSIKIFPNPVKDKLNVESENIPEGTAIGLFNVLGQNVYLNSHVVQKQEIDLSLLPSGIYFLKLQNNSDYKTFKILKE